MSHSPSSTPINRKAVIRALLEQARLDLIHSQLRLHEIEKKIARLAKKHPLRPGV